MKLPHLVMTLGIAGLLLPVSLMAADAPATTKAAAAATETPATPAEAVPLDKPKAKPQCEAVTATRIRPSMKDGCKSAVSPYRQYSKEELERTGEINMAEALRKTDPIFH